MKYTSLFFLMIFSQLSIAQIFDVDTLFWSGPTDNRINLVILPDGYQASELSQFTIDANNFTNSLFTQTPYEEYQNYFNVFTINVPSNESGASHPGTATDVAEPSHPVSVVDNYFGSTFDAFNIHRLLVATKSAAINNVLANNFPTYDQALILTNSPYYGGSGGQTPVASLSVGSDEIAIHELGHSFVSLKDEYYAGDVFASEGINMTQETNPANVKWQNWLDTDGVGIYQHCCGGNSSNWYKPHKNCKMQVLGPAFCAVCIEGTIEKIHSLINVIDSYSPANGDVINLTTATTFAADFVEPIPNSLNSSWSLNGETIGTNLASVEIEDNELELGNNELLLTVSDTTLLLRIENHQTIHNASVLWEINSETSSLTKVSLSSLKIDLFPNPTEEVLNFTIESELKEDFNVSIADLAGNQLYSEDFDYLERKSQIEIGELASGVYLITFNFGHKFSVSRKVIKE